MEPTHPDDGSLSGSESSRVEEDVAPGAATSRGSIHGALARLLDGLYHLRAVLYDLREVARRAVEHGRSLEALACLTALVTQLVCARNSLLPARALARRLPADPRRSDHAAREQLRIVTCALAGEMHEIGLLFQSATARFDGTDAAVFMQLLVECVIAVGDLSLGTDANAPSAFAVTARRRV